MAVWAALTTLQGLLAQVPETQLTDPIKPHDKAAEAPLIPKAHQALESIGLTSLRGLSATA